MRMQIRAIQEEQDLKQKFCAYCDRKFTTKFFKKRYCSNACMFLGFLLSSTAKNAKVKKEKSYLYLFSAIFPATLKKPLDHFCKRNTKKTNQFDQSKSNVNNIGEEAKHDVFAKPMIPPHKFQQDANEKKDCAKKMPKLHTYIGKIMPRNVIRRTTTMTRETFRLMMSRPRDTTIKQTTKTSPSETI